MTTLRTLLALSLLSIAGCCAAADLHVEGSLYQDKTVAPGTTYRSSIAISNSGDTPVAVRLYLTDYTFSADGANQYGAPGSQPRSNASWVHLGQEQVSIPAHGVASVPYQVAVPPDAALRGSYWSIIMIEPLSGAESAGPARKKGELQAALTAVTRYGVQTATEIGNTGQGELQFQNPRLVKGRGAQRALAVDVRNTGDRTLRPQLTLELHDAHGSTHKGVASGAQRLYPASSAEFQLDVSGLAAGKYQALITADAGGDDVFGSQFDLTIE